MPKITQRCFFPLLYSIVLGLSACSWMPALDKALDKAKCEQAESEKECRSTQYMPASYCEATASSNEDNIDCSFYTNKFECQTNQCQWMSTDEPKNCTWDSKQKICKL